MKELKPIRLKIKSLNEDRTCHALVVLDQYMVAGARKADVVIEGGKFAVVKLEILLKDIDLEIPGLPEELPLFPEPVQVEQLAEMLKKSDDDSNLSAWRDEASWDQNWQVGTTVLNTHFLEKIIGEWKRRIECKQAAAALQVTEYGKVALQHGADNVRDCVMDLEELINSRSGIFLVTWEGFVTPANASGKKK
ncbi:hypothetical protein ABO04_05135 [Nitrosomonas sp. HPC101]|uniref:hypothetical protein n=1 Tax=Nitrosomonas sp. HPC101 TaxID=1658667 RepID=UPI00136D9CAC|nr:hypothetical protein [Nitrosomonas sp. HPC101]MXS85318.1 hypothetical protein [Nitrosomonas sp. HPC101]